MRNRNSILSILVFLLAALLSLAAPIPVHAAFRENSQKKPSVETRITRDAHAPSSTVARQVTASPYGMPTAAKIDATSLSARTPEEQLSALTALSLLMNGSGVYPDLDTAKAVWNASFDLALDNAALSTATVSRSDNGNVVLTLQNYSENRQALIHAVIARFGLLRNSNLSTSVPAANGFSAACRTTSSQGTLQDPCALIRATSARVAAGMQYDRNYRTADLLTSLRDGKGVCQQYSILCYILLNAEGIPTRRVRGTLTVHRADGSTETGYHTWNASLVNGSWIPVDFTPYSNGTPNAGIITPERYADYNEWTSY